MLIPPALQQPAPSPSTAKAEQTPLAKLLQAKGVVVSLSRRPVGALYGQGTLEVERLEASTGADTERGLGLHVMGPAKGDGEGRALVEQAEIPALLAALDRFATEAPKLAAGDAGQSFSYTASAGLSLELAKGRDGVAFIVRAGRGQATLAASQIPALKQLIEKAQNP